MADKRPVNHVSDAYHALLDIMAMYPQIKTSDIQQFAPVYYPIALIEMDFDEQSFEDFEDVQLSILQFVSAGIMDPNIISISMGINNPRYIYNVLNLLRSFGHIDDHGITELGTASLSAEKKITYARVKQQFQLDALNGNLLEIDRNLLSGSMLSSDETIPIIGHLGYLDGIPTQYVENQLRSVGFDHYKKYKSTILNSNLITIHNMECVEIQYSKCYLIKLKESKTPTIFGKRYNPGGSTNSERFFWSPLSIDNNAAKTYFVGQNINLNTAAAEQYIMQLATLLTERSKNINFSEAVLNTLRLWNSGISISENNFRINDFNAVRCANVNIIHTDIIKYHNSLLSFLDALTISGELLISEPHLYGKLISITTNDQYILYTVSAYNELKKKVGAVIATKMIKAYLAEQNFTDCQGEVLLKSIYEFCIEQIKATQV